MYIKMSEDQFSKQDHDRSNPFRPYVLITNMWQRPHFYILHSYLFYEGSLGNETYALGMNLFKPIILHYCLVCSGV